MTSSITLCELLEINKDYIKNPLKIIQSRTKLSFKELLAKIKSIPEKILPFDLKGWGLSRDDLDKISNESFTKGRMDNNIVDLSVSDVLRILNNIYSI